MANIDFYNIAILCSNLSRLRNYGERETLDNHANRYNEKVLEYTGMAVSNAFSGVD